MPTSAHRKDVPSRRSKVFPAAGLVVGLALALLVPQAAAAKGAVVANDGFGGRTLSSSWGTASLGGAWSLSKSGSTKFSVSKGRGVLSSLARGAAASATLKKLSLRDVNAVGLIGMPSTAARTYNAFELRRQSDGSRYRGRLNVMSSGSAVLAVSRLTTSGETNLDTVALPFKVAKGSEVRLQFQITGTTEVRILGRASLDGDAVPDWQLDTTDTSSKRITKAGTAGWWLYSSGFNAKAISSTLDNFTVVSNPSVPTDADESPATTTPVESAARPTRGSAAVGTADYAVPASGAVIVSTSGSDSGSGTLASPLRTVAAAVSKATSGDTVVIRGGTYNESVSVPASKSITIQAYPHEAVWFDGSKRVTAWTKSGSTWTTPWSFFPSSVIDGIADNPGYVDSAAPLAARFDQVFVNGAQLTQVAKASQVTAGTFAVDSSAGTVTIGSDPSGQEVRVSNLSQALAVLSPNSTVRGFGVRRYASQQVSIGAVRLAGANVTARNLVVEDSAWIGLNNSAAGGTLDHLTVVRSGLLGIGVNAGYGFALTNSVVDDNNSSHFKAAPVAGGFKITRSRGVTVTNNQVNDNWTTGIWFDESCYDIVVAGNTATGNTTANVELELSQKAIVADNVLTGGKAPVYILNTGDVRVWNNSIGASTVFGIKIHQDSRLASDLSVPGHDKQRPVPDPTVPWVTKDIDVENNAFGAGTGFQIYALNAPAKKITITGNLFNRRTSRAQSVLVAWGYSSTDQSFTSYDSPDALASAVDSRWKNLQTSDIQALSVMTTQIAASTGTASPMPADIAAAVGVPTGTRWIGAVD